jgi:transposase
LQLPPAAREQVTIVLAPIDADDAQLAPLDQELPEYAKRQPDCRALMRHYGIWPLTSITILAVLGDARRFSSSREAPWTSPSTRPTPAVPRSPVPPGTLARRR